jgi:hypothetical protein
MEGAAMQQPSVNAPRHPSPHLGILAIVFTVLFCAGLFPVTAFAGAPYFPGPWEPLPTIVNFFRLRPQAVLLCAFLQFGSAVPLGIFTAAAVSRLHFLGVRAAGANIALFGGLAAAFAVASSSLVLWTLARPGIAQDASVTQALYYLDYALGGPAYSVALGLLMAGVSVVALAYRLTPKWVAILGLALALCGELSWLDLEIPQAIFLVPLTRFPGFLWMIAAGFTLPSSRTPALHKEA